MTLVEEFLERYRREYDFYDQTARLAAQMLEGRLQAAGVRSIVTSRAKSVGRLGPKLHERAARKNYVTMADIYNDIVDLAGVRVALYFPAHNGHVDTIVRQIFSIIGTPKVFPDGSAPKYAKRFSGYSATHYRVHLLDAVLSEAQRRYTDAQIEIQVASVLMHAWAEVEHDLVYKPLQGALSTDEYAILDELNGMVIAGEIALERLQRAGEQRVAVGSRPFSNHYELAAHLLNIVGKTLEGPISKSGLGRVDLLFDLLVQVGLHTPDQLKKYLSALHGDVEKRPIAEQIVDQLLGEDPSRHNLWRELRGGSADVTDPDDEKSKRADALAVFLLAWTDYERTVLSKLPKESLSIARHMPPTPQILQNVGLIDADTKARLEPIRDLRNMAVHGTARPDPAELLEAASRLQPITEQIRRASSLDVP